VIARLHLELAATIAISLAILVTTGCSSQSGTPARNVGSNIDNTKETTNDDPKGKLITIYKAYMTACAKLGRAPGLDELPKYLRESGDPKAIMRGIGIRVQLFEPKLKYSDVVMAWEQNSQNEEYHVLFYSGRIDVLTSHELRARGIAVGEVAEQIANDERARRNQVEEERKKWAEEAARGQEERRMERDRVEADKEYVRIRNALPLGPEVEKFRAVEHDWITRRAAVITEARKKGTITVKENFGFDDYIGTVPLPRVEEVLDTIRGGQPIPVVASGRGEQAKETEKAKNPNASTPDPTRSEADPNRTLPNAKSDIVAALNQKVSLKSPYRQSYEGAPTDRISVQYAAADLLKQVGVDYDFEKSRANLDDLARRWVTPNITGETCEAALEMLLRPLDCRYDVENGKVVLKRK
jgi:hypothetical protein